MNITPLIGRAHLDKALEEGAVAGAVLDDSEEGCPYLSQDKPMLRHAWLRGFRATRAAIQP